MFQILAINPRYNNLEQLTCTLFNSSKHSENNIIVTGTLEQSDVSEFNGTSTSTDVWFNLKGDSRSNLISWGASWVQYPCLYFPKNLERRTGPSPSLSLPPCLDLDRRFFSFFVLFELDRDLDFLEPLSSSSSLLDDSDDASFFVLFDLERDLDFLESLSSSSLADDSDDELELNSEELLCCYKRKCEHIKQI